MKAKYVLMLIFPLLITSVYANGLVFIINLDIYANDSVVSNSISVSDGTISHFTPSETPYKIKVFSGSSELFSANFQVSFGMIFDPPRPGTNLEKQNVQYRVPYYSDADKIKIYHSGNEIFSIDLKEDFCNENGVCDLGESKYNCEVDCGDEVTEKPSKIWILFIIAPIVLVLLFVFIKISTRNKLKQQNQNMNSGYE